MKEEITPSNKPTINVEKFGMIMLSIFGVFIIGNILSKSLKNS
jgi:hypothetical protein